MSQNLILDEKVDKFLKNNKDNYLFSREAKGRVYVSPVNYRSRLDIGSANLFDLLEKSNFLVKKTQSEKAKIGEAPSIYVFGYDKKKYVGELEKIIIVPAKVLNELPIANWNLSEIDLRVKEKVSLKSSLHTFLYKLK